MGTRTVGPLVDPDCTAQIETNPIVRARIKAVDARLEGNVACPAHRKVVIRQPSNRRIETKVEIDGLIVANGHRVAFKLPVRPVFSLPRRYRWKRQFLPPKANTRVPTPFIVLDSQIVITLRGPIVSREFPHWRVAPVVDDELVVDPGARSVVDDQMESIQACAKAGRAGPARGKVVRGHAKARSTRAPIKIEIGIVANPQRDAAQVTHRVIFSAPIWVPSQLFPPDGDLSWTNAFVILDAQIVITSWQITFGDQFAHTAVAPLVHYQFSINIHAHAVVDECVKAIFSFREPRDTRPANRKVLRRH